MRPAAEFLGAMALFFGCVLVVVIGILLANLGRKK